MIKIKRLPLCQQFLFKYYQSALDFAEGRWFDLIFPSQKIRPIKLISTCYAPGYYFSLSLELSALSLIVRACLCVSVANYLSFLIFSLCALRLCGEKYKKRTNLLRVRP
jgi:hypothetical protein